MLIPTIEDRLKTVAATITMLQLAICADHDKVQVDIEDVLEALRPQAAHAADELYWIRCALTDEQLKQPAPTDDDRPVKRGGAQ